MGGTLLLIIMFLPNGLWSLVERWRGKPAPKAGGAVVGTEEEKA